LVPPSVPNFRNPKPGGRARPEKYVLKLLKKCSRALEAKDDLKP
jgi:hypothetical protein